MLQIRLLGQFDIRLDGKRVVIPSRSGQSLLAYLVLTAGTAQRREKIAGTIWPDTSDENARKNLRQELWRIRKAISAQHLTTADDYLLADEFTLTFNRDADYWLDVAILVGAVNAAAGIIDQVELPVIGAIWIGFGNIRRFFQGTYIQARSIRKDNVPGIMCGGNSDHQQAGCDCQN